MAFEIAIGHSIICAGCKFSELTENTGSQWNNITFCKIPLQQNGQINIHSCHEFTWQGTEEHGSFAWWYDEFTIHLLLVVKQEAGPWQCAEAIGCHLPMERLSSHRYRAVAPEPATGQVLEIFCPWHKNLMSVFYQEIKRDQQDRLSKKVPQEGNDWLCTTALILAVDHSACRLYLFFHLRRTLFFLCTSFVLHFLFFFSLLA